ncbi:MAG: hypothetical protein IPN43_15645 [Chitinophagaceae bacterium]|nr:hypothetical protein [Chitinophagaceae bacterium]
MKKIISLLMLVMSITGTAIAQQEPGVTNADKIFNIPAGYLKRSFTADLGKGNKMQIELTDLEDLDRFKNIDSLLRIFLQDMAALKDSLTDELSAKRIDYFTDELGRKKIHIRLSKPDGASFLLQQGNLSALKLEQDTVIFSGSYVYKVTSTLLKPFTEMRYYRLSFFVNQLSDLNSLSSAGLNEKINSIQKSQKSRWVKGSDDTWHLKNGDQSIYSNHQPRGYVSGTGAGDYLTSLTTVSIQNYKNYFVPSVSLGIGLGYNNGKVKRELGLLWEPNFFFAKNAQGSLQTYRNDFLTFTYKRFPLKKEYDVQSFSFINGFSFGYLIRRKGEFFEKNTMRIGVQAASLLKGKINLEPVLYFNNFFKGVTPGLRLTVNF